MFSKILSRKHKQGKKSYISAHDVTIMDVSCLIQLSLRLSRQTHQSRVGVKSRNAPGRQLFSEIWIGCWAKVKLGKLPSGVWTSESVLNLNDCESL